ncbi:hypothetical protein PUT78_04710 [Roseinatronobacter sp. HJB301]|uniref:Adenylosuccinate lyase n=1 Tax=Roseinatronobacter alkalisoli TaxID=3028235 RepID=A0ABT5T5K7_9RHOB|nr:hypothetical protein [Roseinatronobacter sp. HJB301]
MKLKLALAAVAFALAPAVASAMCSGMKHETTASGCTAGQVWDADSATCVEPVTG